MAIKAISGGAFQDAQGNKIALGSLVLRLSQDANITGVGLLAPKEVTFTTDASGNVSGSLYFNDQLTPSGTYYTATLFDASGRKVFGPENWSLTGSSPLDVGTLVPSSSAISYSGAVLLSPTGDQVITSGDLTVTENLIAGTVSSEGDASVVGDLAVSGSTDLNDGLTVASGDISGTEASAIKLFNTNGVYAKVSQDTTFGTTIRRTDSNTPTYVSVVPNGTIADGTAKAIWRVYGTDIKADPTNFESIDLEAEKAPVSSPGGPLAVYYLKSRIGGSGSHRGLVHQFGGINVLYIDPTTGAIVTAPKSGDSVGASVDFISAGCSRGDINIGINGRALRSTNAAGTNTIVLISGDSSDSAVISQATKHSGKIIQYNGIATAGIGSTSVYGATSQKSESSADANVLTYTPPAVAGQYRINFSMSVSASASGVLGWTVTYKDSNGTSQAPTNLSLLKNGTAAPALTFTAAANDTYTGSVIVDVNNSATAIVVKLTLASGTFTAKVSASIEQLQ